MRERRGNLLCAFGQPLLRLPPLSCHPQRSVTFDFEAERLSHLNEHAEAFDFSAYRPPLCADMGRSLRRRLRESETLDWCRKSGRSKRTALRTNEERWRRAEIGAEGRTAGPSPAVGMTDRRGWLQGENSCRGGTPLRTHSHHFCANKKVTASQDDGFVWGRKAAGRCCSSNSQKTRSLHAKENSGKGFAPSRSTRPGLRGGGASSSRLKSPPSLESKKSQPPRMTALWGFDEKHIPDLLIGNRGQVTCRRSSRFTIVGTARRFLCSLSLGCVSCMAGLIPASLLYSTISRRSRKVIMRKKFLASGFQRFEHRSFISSTAKDSGSIRCREPGSRMRNPRPGRRSPMSELYSIGSAQTRSPICQA